MFAVPAGCSSTQRF